MYFAGWVDDLFTCFNEIFCKIQGVQASRESCFHFAEKLLIDVKQASKKVVIIGNGGSFAIASHISQDIINKLKTSSLIINDPSLITCISNDAGYENVFSQPLNVLLNEQDLLIAISDSGESANILKSIQVAKQKNCKIIALSAFKPTNSLHNIGADIAIHVPTFYYSIAEVTHLAILHAWVDELAGVQLQNVREITHNTGIPV